MVYPRRRNEVIQRHQRTSPAIRRMRSRFGTLNVNPSLLHSLREISREGRSEANSTLPLHLHNLTNPIPIRETSFDSAIDRRNLRPNLTLPPTQRLDVTDPNRSSHVARTPDINVSASQPRQEISSVFYTDEVHVGEEFVTINRKIKIPLKPGHYKIPTLIANAPYPSSRSPSLSNLNYTQPKLNTSSGAQYRQFSTPNQQEDYVNAERWATTNSRQGSVSPNLRLSFDDNQGNFSAPTQSFTNFHGNRPMSGVRTRPSFRGNQLLSRSRSAYSIPQEARSMSRMCPCFLTPSRTSLPVQRINSDGLITTRPTRPMRHICPYLSMSPRTASPIHRSNSDWPITRTAHPMRQISPNFSSPRTNDSSMRTLPVIHVSTSSITIDDMVTQLSSNPPSATPLFIVIDDSKVSTRLANMP